MSDLHRNDIRTLTSRFNEALTGAADLHARQTRKGTDTPYIAHLLGVASIALEYGADEDAAIAALLHDGRGHSSPSHRGRKEWDAVQMRTQHVMLQNDAS